MNTKRRDFLKNACAPVLISVMGIPLIEACSKEDDSSETLTNTTIEINISNSKFNSLASIGGWMNYTEENLLLIRISEDEIRAFNNACPHQGFRTGWSFDENIFTCSNHGNSFTNSCSSALKCYETSLNGDILTVKR